MVSLLVFVIPSISDCTLLISLSIYSTFSTQSSIAFLDGYPIAELIVLEGENWAFPLKSQSWTYHHYYSDSTNSFIKFTIYHSYSLSGVPANLSHLCFKIS